MNRHWRMIVSRPQQRFHFVDERADLERALTDFQGRERRFGGILEDVV